MITQNPQHILENNPDISTYPDMHPDRQYAYNIIFKVIRNDAGVRTTGDVGEPEVMNAVRDLNLNFNQFNIFFKYRGFEYIDDTNLSGDQSQAGFYNNFIAPYSSPNEFCIFILDGNILSNDIYGNIVSAPGLGYMLGNITFVNTFGLTSRILSHEVGHNFYLYHDFKNFVAEVGCEHVTRILDNEFYNASEKGDQVWDTPATKIWDLDQYSPDGFYFGLDLDCSTNPDNTARMYKYAHARYDNFMHYHDGADMGNYVFSPGQGRRIRWVISQDLQQQYGIWNHAMTEIENLYQPFEVLNVPGEAVISVTDNGNGTARVCRNWVRNDRFQKGFDCIYYSMDGTQSDTAVPDDLKTATYRTVDYQVEIAQIAPGVKETIPVICNRGVICTDEPYMGGILFSTKVLGSMNITTQQLTEIQAKDPELFNKLMEDYYYILKKYTSSGAEYSVTFYKD